MLPRRRTRRPYRPPTGMPPGREDWRLGSGVSVLVHLAILVLVLSPLAVTDLSRLEQGAGGAGPAGGGGGGHRGTGAMRAELLRFVRIAAAEPAVAAPAVQPPPPPLPEPKPALVAESELPALKTIDPTMPVGVGGGTGQDPAGGSGPGSGGGVGAGVGAGRGSGVGPGTGGGTQANFPPTPTEMFIPPLPVPKSASGFRVVAEFDIDEAGRVLSLTFTETPDRGYNRRLRDVLRGFKFRPGTTPDGTPVRMKVQISIDLP